MFCLIDCRNYANKQQMTMVNTGRTFKEKKQIEMNNKIKNDF